MEQFAKAKVLVERTYLIPLKNGKSYNGDTPEEVVESWFGEPLTLNKSHHSRDSYRLGGADTIISTEITELVDLEEGTL